MLDRVHVEESSEEPADASVEEPANASTDEPANASTEEPADFPRRASDPGSPRRDGSPPRGRGAARWVSYVAILGLGALLGFLGFQATLSSPSARASVLLTPLVGNPYAPSSASLQNMETEARLVTADEVSASVAEKLGPGLSADDLASRTSASAVAGSQVLEIAHTADSEEFAKDAAQVFAESYLAQRQERARRYIEDQSAALQVAIDLAETDLRAAAKEVTRTRPGTEARELAQQNLSIASETLAARTDDVSALRSTGTDPGQVVALASESPNERAWLWIGGGIILASAVVALLQVLSMGRKPDGQPGEQA